MSLLVLGGPLRTSFCLQQGFKWMLSSLDSHLLKRKNNPWLMYKKTMTKSFALPIHIKKVSISNKQFVSWTFLRLKMSFLGGI